METTKTHKRRSVLVAVALVAAANGADNTTTMTLTTTTAVPIVTATERTPDSSSCHLKEGGIGLGASKEARQFTGAAFATLDSLGTIGSGTKQYRSSKLQAVPNTYYRISPLELPEGTVFPVGTDATNVKYDVSDYNCKKDGVDPCFISINNDDGTLVVFFPTPTTSGTTARSVTITVRSEEYKEETLFEKIEFRVANPVPFDVTYVTAATDVHAQCLCSLCSPCLRVSVSLCLCGLSVFLSLPPPPSLSLSLPLCVAVSPWRIYADPFPILALKHYNTKSTLLAASTKVPALDQILSNPI